MEPYTFFMNVRLTDGKVCQIEFTAVPCHRGFIYLGVNELHVSGDIIHIPFVSDWLTVKREAEEAADQYFKNLKAVA